MRELRLKFVSEEESERGHPKTFTHKWECFHKLRIYERMGTPAEVERWKSVYDKLLDVLNTEEFIKYLKNSTKEV